MGNRKAIGEVNLKGVEPLTFSSVVRCSIQLSYKSVLCSRFLNGLQK